MTLFKFSQEKPENQLNFFNELKLHSTCLKLVDFLEDYNLKGGVPEALYTKILCRKAFYNFIVRKRYYVTKDIVNRQLVPLHQVIALFSFIYPEAYFEKLQSVFKQDIADIPNLKEIKRIKIYRHLITVNNQNVEHEALLEQIRKKIDQTSMETVMDFGRKDIKGKDVYYQRQVLDSAKQLTSDELDSLRQFLPFFIRQRIYLQRWIWMNAEKKKLPEQVLMKDPIGLNFDPRLCDEYFKQYKTEDQKSLVLQFCEMIIFHSLILLLNSK